VCGLNLEGMSSIESVELDRTDTDTTYHKTIKNKYLKSFKDHQFGDHASNTRAYTLAQQIIVIVAGDLTTFFSFSISDLAYIFPIWTTSSSATNVGYIFTGCPEQYNSNLLSPLI
jgi:hypothetical protein